MKKQPTKLMSLGLALTLALGLCALGGAAVYFALAFGLGLREARLSVSLIKQIGKRG